MIKTGSRRAMKYEYVKDFICQPDEMYANGCMVLLLIFFCCFFWFGDRVWDEIRIKGIEWIGDDSI